MKAALQKKQNGILRIRSNTHNRFTTIAPKKNFVPSVEDFQKEMLIEAKNIEKQKIIATFQQHPLSIVIKCVVTLFLGAIVVGLTSYLPFGFLAVARFWFTLTALLLITAVIVRFIIIWYLNVDFIKEKEIIMVRQNGVFSHAIETFLLEQVKSFDIEQKGFWQSVLDCGDIHITSMMGSHEDIILKNIWPARKAFSLMQDQISHLLISHLLTFKNQNVGNY